MLGKNTGKKANVKNDRYVGAYESIYSKNRTNSTTRNDRLNGDSSSNEQKKKKLYLVAEDCIKKAKEKLDYRKNDDRSEQITFAPEIEESVESVSKKRKSKSERLAEEIEKNHQIFSALLPISMAVLELVGTESIPLSADSLLSKWKYSLSLGNCETLLHNLNGFISEDTEDATASLRKWMDFLEKSGIKQLDNNVDRIIISAQNRANYQNGYEFKDGVECIVEQHPWIYRDILICPGMLMQVQETETDGNGSEVNRI